MKARRGFCGALLAALVCVLLGVSSAGATTVTVGQLFAPDATCGTLPNTFLQTGVGIGTSYTVPKAGVITSWSFEDGPDVLSGLKLKVGRSAGGVMYEIVAESAAGTQAANSVHNYAVHISVKAGDLIGLSSSGGSGECGTATANPADHYAQAAGDQAPGTTTSYTGLTGAKLSISAKVALDCVVPGLKGMTLKAAKTALKKASCTLGKVTPKGQTTGTVKSQQPAAGKTLAPGTKVSVRLG